MLGFGVIKVKPHFIVRDAKLEELRYFFWESFFNCGGVAYSNKWVFKCMLSLIVKARFWVK
ncbi:MAG: hypothetical protein EAY66_02020 [Sphingobacteriales bacterium]|nr:MAG: hypothetical protein EAY66_02020 [Sphingobacteriales bacterium]